MGKGEKCYKRYEYVLGNHSFKESLDALLKGMIVQEEISLDEPGSLSAYLAPYFQWEGDNEAQKSCLKNLNREIKEQLAETEEYIAYARQAYEQILNIIKTTKGYRNKLSLDKLWEKK